MSTELSAQPFQYQPSVDDNNNYVDAVPNSSAFKLGVRCGCSSRNTLFTTRQTLTSHFKTITHQKWIENQNKEKQNHLRELLELRETVKQQVLLIAERDQKIIKLEKIIREKDIAIRTLSSLLHTAPEPAEEVNLLDIDM